MVSSRVELLDDQLVEWAEKPLLSRHQLRVQDFVYLHTPEEAVGQDSHHA